MSKHTHILNFPLKIDMSRLALQKAYCITFIKMMTMIMYNRPNKEIKKLKFENCDHFVFKFQLYFTTT